MTSRPFFLLALLSAGASVCYRPTLVDCTVTCTSTNGCPSPLSCVDGYCTRSSCPAHIDGGQETMADAMDGDAPDTPDDTTDGSDANDVSDASDAADVPDVSDASDVSDLSDASDVRDVSPELLPTSIPDLMLWLDPETGLSIESILLWQDRSPARHSASAVPVPALIPAADGRPPMLDFTDRFQDLKLGGPVASVGHLFIVAEPRTPPVSNSDAGGPFDGMMMLIDFSYGLGDLSGAMRYGLSATERLYANYDLNGSPVTYERFPIRDAEGNLSLQLFEVRVTADTSSRALVTHFKNGADLGSVFTTAYTGVSRQSNLVAGSNASADPSFRGKLGEVVIYNRPLSEAERLKVESYLLDKWRLR